MFNEMRKTFQRRFESNIDFERYMEDLTRAQRNNFQEAKGRAVDQRLPDGGIEEEYYVRNYTNIIESGDKFPGPQGNGEGVLPGSLADQLRDFINAMRTDPG